RALAHPHLPPFPTRRSSDLFPAHRNLGLNNSAPGPSLTNWWGTSIIGYARNQSNLFHCPSLKTKRFDNGVRWEWKFDCHLVGYGDRKSTRLNSSHRTISYAV